VRDELWRFANRKTVHRGFDLLSKRLEGRSFWVKGKLWDLAEWDELADGE
jgi:predicted RNA-binding protein YlxR (DUF448 family)